MSIRVALHHRTAYAYSKPVQLGPQIIRLRPAPHSRTPILSYSLKIQPSEHFCNWQQDPQGNFLARLVFPKPTSLFEVAVDLVADMSVINPFDFFIDEIATKYPFEYESWQAGELLPFRQIDRSNTGPLFDGWVAPFRRETERTIDHLIAINQQLQKDIEYGVRLEPGVQTPEETLRLRKGSCRDSAWLMVHVCRELGYAARFASGYLIQLAADQESLDGPSGPKTDFTDLHAWSEIYLPGAGWIGFDPTSGLLCGEGHIPLACSPEPTSASPIQGLVEPAECDFSFAMKVTRIHEDPRTTKPYTDAQWDRIDALGQSVDMQLQRDDVRLTFGGEPTFVSIDDMEGAEWNSTAVGPNKTRLASDLLRRLHHRFGRGGMLFHGQGKWYPGESLPRWAMACYWRTDGQPLWQNPNLLADNSRDYGITFRKAKRFAKRLAVRLGVEPHWLMPAYEDIYYYLWKEQRLPKNVEAVKSNLEDPEERARLTRIYGRGLSNPVALVLPIRRQWQQSRASGANPGYVWSSGPWPVRREGMFLLPGDSPVGLRLPIDTLPYSGPTHPLAWTPEDPFSLRPALPTPAVIRPQVRPKPPVEKLVYGPGGDLDDPDESLPEPPPDVSGFQVHRTAMCFEPRDGRLYIFMPPTERLEDYVELLWHIEATAEELQMPVVIEGYEPPRDYRLNVLKVTPDPGVIEVNVQPASSWSELSTIVNGLYEDARNSRLGTEKFDLDGKHTGTGGGNHIVMGGPTPADSPFLRRPDLLRSLIAYWINHPSLSYIFSGRFVGPTSQSPRVDEGRRDAMYELEMALELLPKRGQPVPPWLVDRILRNLLTDLTGNTHRAEFCIDKLCSPDGSAGRLGLVELRAYEMPPHAQMSLATQLLIRNLIAVFWRSPYEQPPIRWDLRLHDQFMLPHYLEEDMKTVLRDMQAAGWYWDPTWFQPHIEFRFPRIGRVNYDGVSIELRYAIEPWYVLGEEAMVGGMTRFVDSSVERLQVKVQGFDFASHQILVNGYICPMTKTTVPGEAVCGVRYRAWQPPSCLHPTIPIHTPLTIDLVDLRAGRSIGGCNYFVSHPGGRNYEQFPVNALEAEARRAGRFWSHGHSPGPKIGRIPKPNPDFPTTLDLRREL
jgi:uncharacterized protein (DUF2126 family)/transglutaminase-like putative cysteine protease